MFTCHSCHLTKFFHFFLISSKTTLLSDVTKTILRFGFHLCPRCNLDVPQCLVGSLVWRQTYDSVCSFLWAASRRCHARLVRADAFKSADNPPLCEDREEQTSIGFAILGYRRSENREPVLLKTHCDTGRHQCHAGA